MSIYATIYATYGVTTANLLAIGAVLAAILGAGRLVRNITFDEFPPTMAFRKWWDSKTGESGWNELFHCAYCLGTWIGIVSVALISIAMFTALFPFWLSLVVLGLYAGLAVGYVASIVVATNWG